MDRQEIKTPFLMNFGQAFSWIADLNVVPCVECLQVEFPIRLCSPEPQVDGVVGLEARDGVVVCYCTHLYKRMQVSSSTHLIEYFLSYSTAKGNPWTCCGPSDMVAVVAESHN